MLDHRDMSSQSPVDDGPSLFSVIDLVIFETLSSGENQLPIFKREYD